MAKLQESALRVIRSYGPSISHHLVAHLSAQMDATGTEHLTLEDVTVAMYKVLSAFEGAAQIETGHVADIQQKLSNRSLWTTMREYLNGRNCLANGGAK